MRLNEILTLVCTASVVVLWVILYLADILYHRRKERKRKEQEEQDEIR